MQGGLFLSKLEMNDSLTFLPHQLDGIINTLGLLDK